MPLCLHVAVQGASQAQKKASTGSSKKQAPTAPWHHSIPHLVTAGPRSSKSRRLYGHLRRGSQGPAPLLDSVHPLCCHCQLRRVSETQNLRPKPVRLSGKLPLRVLFASRVFQEDGNVEKLVGEAESVMPTPSKRLNPNHACPASGTTLRRFQFRFPRSEAREDVAAELHGSCLRLSCFISTAAIVITINITNHVAINISKIATTSSLVAIRLAAIARSWSSMSPWSPSSLDRHHPLDVGSECAPFAGGRAPHRKRALHGAPRGAAPGPPPAREPRKGGEKGSYQGLFKKPRNPKP